MRIPLKERQLRSVVAQVARAGRSLKLSLPLIGAYQAANVLVAADW